MDLVDCCYIGLGLHRFGVDASCIGVEGHTQGYEHSQREMDLSRDSRMS